MIREMMRQMGRTPPSEKQVRQVMNSMNKQNKQRCSNTFLFLCGKIFLSEGCL